MADVAGSRSRSLRGAQRRSPRPRLARARGRAGDRRPQRPGPALLGRRGLRSRALRPRRVPGRLDQPRALALGWIRSVVRDGREPGRGGAARGRDRVHRAVPSVGGAPRRRARHRAHAGRGAGTDGRRQARVDPPPRGGRAARRLAHGIGDAPRAGPALGRPRARSHERFRGLGHGRRAARGPLAGRRSARPRAAAAGDPRRPGARVGRHDQRRARARHGASDREPRCARSPPHRATCRTARSRRSPRRAASR